MMISLNSGPKTLVQKVKQAKGVTVRRIQTKKQQTAKTEREVEEDKRTKEIAKRTKQIDRISSHMNLCQAIVKPDCSKPTVQNAQGIQKALVHLLIQSCATNIGDTVLDEESGKVQLENEETVIYSPTKVKHHLTCFNNIFSNNELISNRFAELISNRFAFFVTCTHILTYL